MQILEADIYKIKRDYENMYFTIRIVITEIHKKKKYVLGKRDLVKVFFYYNLQIRSLIGEVCYHCEPLFDQ